MKSKKIAYTIASLIALGNIDVLMSSAAAQSVSANSAQQCVADLKTFDSQLKKDGYWLHGDGYGYGYPVYGYGYSYDMPAGPVTNNGDVTTGYSYARPGYEVRTLLSSANILAQRGDQRACESLLTSAREIYSTYVTEIRSSNMPRVSISAWRQQQIASAVSVKGTDLAFRSDQLVGAGVVNAKGEDLGSVDDIVLSPQTGQIAYLVIGRGGIFGIDKKYVPVPWESFKAAPGSKLLVLSASKALMDTAPQIKRNQNFQKGEFTSEALKVSTYWATHLTPS